MKIIQSKLLNRNKTLLHGFTSKKNKNLAFHVGDNPQTVLQNHKYLAKTLNYDYKKLVHMKQIHSNLIKIVDENDCFENPPQCDALITDKKNTPLMVMVADCSPLLFFDPKKEIIAVAHVGRAGAFSNIVKSVIESFTNDFQSSTQDIQVTIGASIKECCYEVGEEIALEADKEFSYSILKRGESYFLDISKIIARQLKSLNIEEKNIDFSSECSCCIENHFSYRREHQTGREAGIIML
jgi:hypothetical protein